jgi:DNA-binding SARP family transcriptional activator/TolB-like protein
MNHAPGPQKIGAAQTEGVTPSGPVLSISVIGGAHFSYDGREVDLRNRKARAIFAYLALTPAGEEPREKLAGLFWSEFSEHNARATLRQAIHEFREALHQIGCDAVVSGRTAVGLKPGSYHVDLDEILNAVATREAPETLLHQERLAEALLAGYEDLDPSFHVWLMARRQGLHDRLIRGLEDGYRDAAVDARRRRRMAQATLLLDPTHEEACRIVMRCAAEAGETGTAIRAYDELYRLLDEDYDMEPSAATQELIAEIKQGKYDVVPVADAPVEAGLSYAAEMRQAQVAPRRAAPVAEPRPLPLKPALFVEPFAMSGIGPDSLHLIEGFRLELIACLTRFREWYVAGIEADVTDDDYNSRVSARYGLMTTAYQAGAAINVVMVLQERPSGVAIWGERFELRLDQWFEVQQRILRRIAATLDVQVSTQRLARMSSPSNVSPAWYDSWLRGQWVVRRFDAGEWNRAAEMLAQGIEHTPTFSPFYSCLAQMNNAAPFVQPGMFRDRTQAALTVSLAQKAVTLDPLDARAELHLGWALAFARRYGLAKIHMDLACELNANDPHTLVSAGHFYALYGDIERARELSALAMETTLALTPRHWVYEANIRYLDGDDEGALAALDRTEDAVLTVMAWRAAALANLGRVAASRREAGRFNEEVRANWINNEPATDQMIVRWFLQSYPLRLRATWQRLRDGLAAAGFTVDGLTHAEGTEVE